MGKRLNDVTSTPTHPAKATGCKKTSWPAGTRGKRKNMMIFRSRGSPKTIDSSRGREGRTLDRARPAINAGRARMNPVKGPATPISKSSFLRVMGDLIRIKAPRVPMRVGAGMKYGSVALIP
jgi:hypothetical protein